MSDCESLLDLWKRILQDMVGGESGDTHEQSEKINEGVPPDCQEDPAYYHQYPGCPYSGGCPYGGCPPGRCLTPPSKPEPKMDTPKADDKLYEIKFIEGHLGGDEPQAAPPSRAPEHKPSSVLPNGGSEDVPAHPEVDTTEFRPREDAKKGEFDPAPLSVEE
jgi:hypothetical protein